MNILKWFSTPQSTDQINRRNLLNVQIDAIGVGLANGAAPFLPVFLTRLGATSLEVGLLTTMPAVTGLLLAIPLGRMLQNTRNIVPWFSRARLLTILSYALTGLITFIVPEAWLVKSILIVWAIVTIPQTILGISFSVVMNAIAGPQGRFELMSRRWSILGTTTAITVFLLGQVLERLPFPLNYQVAFIGLSIGGVISYYFSNRIELPDNQPVPNIVGHSIIESARNYLKPILAEKPFIGFMSRRFVFLTGTFLANPLFPLYFVREVHAPDSWIAIINTAQTAILIVGYFFWTRQSRKSGSRTVLLWTTVGVSLYPLLTSITHQVELITVYAGIAGIFQAGLNLVFFDELMKTVPAKYSATFVSFAQSLEYTSMIFAPLIGSALADTVGIGAGLAISGALRFLGFILFLTQGLKKPSPVSA